MHFLEKYEIMVLRLSSKFELLRLCKATGAAARSTFGTPSPDEIGFVKQLSVRVRVSCGKMWVGACMCARLCSLCTRCAKEQSSAEV